MPRPLGPVPFSHIYLSIYLVVHAHSHQSSRHSGESSIVPGYPIRILVGGTRRVIIVGRYAMAGLGRAGGLALLLAVVSPGERRAGRSRSLVPDAVDEGQRRCRE